MPTFPLMLFAAGFGTRMGKLTADKPKPLIEVAGRPLLDHALELADAVNPRPTVINLHYRGEQIARHLQGRAIALSWEAEEILDTGGGLKNALSILGDGPILTMNTDAVWSGENPLQELASHWSDAEMDALLLLLPIESATGHSTSSDFLLDREGRIVRAKGATGQVYLGAQIIRGSEVAAVPESKFGMNLVWDKLIAKRRAYGLIHRGAWCDVGRPEGIALAEALLNDV